MPKAILLEPVSLDTSDASKFGDVVCLFEKKERRSSIWSKAFTAEILQALEEQNYDPNHDFLIFTGHLVPLIIITATIVSNYGPFNALFYSATDGNYVNRKIGDNHELQDG